MPETEAAHAPPWFAAAQTTPATEPAPTPREQLAPLPLSQAATIALAVAAPAAIGAILMTLAHEPSPVLVVPAITYGVLAATSPALYIGTAAAAGARAAPSLIAMVRAIGTALGAFGVALAGLVLPTAFLAVSSVSATTTIAVTTATVLAAGMIAQRRLAAELTAVGMPRTLGTALVFFGWSAATLGIAGRLWFELVHEVLS
jgi:hypothetical protein